MQNIQQDTPKNQAVGAPETRKIGVEIVKSANLSSRFFHGPRRGRAFPIFDDNELWAHRLEEATQ